MAIKRTLVDQPSPAKSYSPDKQDTTPFKMPPTPPPSPFLKNILEGR